MRYLPLVLCTLALPATAQEADPAVTADLLAAVAANGCLMTEDEADLLLDPLGHSQDAVRAAAQALIAEGRALLDGTTFMLLPETCAEVAAAASATDPEALVDFVLQVFRDNDCTISQDILLGAIDAAGLTVEDFAVVGPRFEALEESGEIVEDALTETLTLSAALCTGVASVPDPRAAVLSIYADHGCVLSRRDLTGLAGVSGLSDDLWAATLRAMEEAGEITDTDQGQALRADLCQLRPVSLEDPVVAQLSALFATGDCTMTRLELGGAMRDAGLDMDAAEPLLLRLEGLVRRGEAVLDGNIYTLPPTLCAVAAPAEASEAEAVMAFVMDTFRANNCVLTEAILEAAVEGSGLEEAQFALIGDEIDGMVERGEIIVDEAAGNARLSADLCTPVDAPEEAAPAEDETGPAPLAADAAMTLVVDVLRGAGCSLPRPDALAAILEGGLSEARLEQLEILFEAHVLSGGLVVDETANTIGLSDAVCTGGPLPPTMIDTLRRTLVMNDCAAGPGLLGMAWLQAGLDGEMYQPVVDFLMAEGEVMQGDDGVVTLLDPACTVAPAEVEPLSLPPPPASELLVMLIRDDLGCSTTFRQLVRVMPGVGLNPADAGILVADLIALGQAGQIGVEVILAPQVCDPGQPAPDPRDALIAALVDNGCRLNEDDAPNLLPVYGTVMDAAEPAAEALIAEGLAILQANELVLSPSACAGARQ